MSFANFGIGLGAFAQGLTNGMQLGRQVRDARNDNKMRKAREQGMADAKAARSSAIDSLIQTGSAPNADNTMTVPTYQVGGQSFADEGSARKAAEGKVGSLDDYYQRVAAPKIYEQYLEIDPEKAEAWRAWNEQKQVKAGQRHWAQAVMKANMGDFDGFGQELVKAYNTRGYFEDGTEVKDWKTLKDDKGNITGAQLTFKGPDGKEFSQVINGMDDAYRVGAFMMSPENVFNTGWSEIQAAKKAQIEMAKEDRKFQRDVALEDRRESGRVSRQQSQNDAALERTVIGKQMDSANKTAAVDAKVAALKKAGYSDAFINEALPAMLGIGEYKKAAAPEEVRRMLHQARLSSDYNYARKSPQEQAAVIEQDMQLINGPQQRRNPMAGGMQSQAPAGRGPMILDTQTGQLVPYGR